MARGQQDIAQGERENRCDEEGLAGDPSGQQPRQGECREDDDGGVHGREGADGGFLDSQLAADLRQQARGQEFGGHGGESGRREDQKPGLGDPCWL